MILSSATPSAGEAPLFITGFPGSGLRLVEALARQARGDRETPSPIDRPAPAQIFRATNDGILAGAEVDWNRFRASEDGGKAPDLTLGGPLEGGLAFGVFASPTLIHTWTFWLHVNPGARLIVVVRHPAEAIGALRARRPELEEAEGIELWLAYAHAALGALADPRVSVVHFEAVFERPEEEMRRLWGVQRPFSVDHARRTRWVRDAAIPRHLATYASLCAAAGPVFAAARNGPEFAAGQAESVSAARRIQAWRDDEDGSNRDRRAAADRDALVVVRAQARAAQDRLAEVEGSLIYRAAKATASLMDRLFPQGTRRRSARRLARSLVARASPPGPIASLDPDENEYALHRLRAPVPRVEAVSWPVRLVTIDDTETLSLGSVESVRAQDHIDWTWRVSAPFHDGARALASKDPRIALSSIVETDPFVAMARAVDGLRDDAVVILLQNGAVLDPRALSHLLAAIQAGSAEAAYGDLDRLDQRGVPVRPWFKPDWSPDLTLSIDLLAPVVALRARHFREPVLAKVRPGLWTWRFALHLRASGANVAHVRQVLSHVPESMPTRMDEAPAMIAEALGAEGRRDVRVSCEDRRLRIEWRASPEMVSIIVPTKDQAQMLSVCLRTIFERTTYRPFEVILVDTGSVEPATERLYATYRDRPGFSLVRQTGSFNFSRACNAGARAARGSRLLFLNNDTEIVHDDWLDRMAQWLEDRGVGAVGARLLYPDSTLQHAGVVVGMAGLAGHLFHQQHLGVSGAFGGEDWYRDLSAVTAACLLTPRAAFEDAGGFDETLELVYGDTDYCLRLRERGLRIVYSPDAELVHHEKQSRGKTAPRSDFVRFSEKLLAGGALWGDPYFNPALSYKSARPRLSIGAADQPMSLHRRFMADLPRRPTIAFPDDLL